MYKNNNRNRHLAHGMLIIGLLLGSNAIAGEAVGNSMSDIQPRDMAEEILAQGESALAELTAGQRMANNWHDRGQLALAEQLNRQPGETLVANKPDCTEKKSPLANASEHCKQIEG